MVGCQKSGHEICFHVNSPTYLTDEARFQIFSRCYYTKGTDLDLGAYTIKYLTENYLGGRVTVEPDKVEGTTFKIFLPIEGNLRNSTRGASALD